MDLNKVVFSREQVSELYGNQLVAALDTEDLVTTTKKEEPIHFKGKNKKNIVWLIEEADQPFLKDADFQFLTKVLEACGLNLDDIALVNMSNANHAYQLIIHQLQPKLLLASGVSSNKISFNAPLYTIEKETGSTFFSTNSVEDMRNDTVKKSKLWVGLKQILSIS